MAAAISGRLVTASLLLAAGAFRPGARGLLHAGPNEIREALPLDGFWLLVAEQANSAGYGFDNGWASEDFAATFTNATAMPVPSAFNDVTQSASLRGHVGWVWYQREVRLPRRLVDDAQTSLVLRFGSVNYYCDVFWNGHHVGNHTGGHLPFEFELDKSILRSPEANFVTVAVNNTLSAHTVPHGEFVYKRDTDVYPAGFFEQTPDFDFFNYAGILRPVSVYTRHADYYVAGVRLTPQMDGVNGRLGYEITLGGPKVPKLGYVSLYDPKHFRPENEMIMTPLMNPKIKPNVMDNNLNAEFSGYLVQPDPIKWEPRNYGKEQIGNKYGYLYMFEVALYDASRRHKVDVYRIPFGFRTVKWDNGSLYINDKPFYCKGFGMHEDSEIRGRGYDPVVLIKDYNMLEWLGANCYRTSHYPYAEERYYEADRRGIVIVSETPGVGLRHFTADNLALHKSMVRDMIDRDANHPSVIAWSMANEPQTYQHSSRQYFKELIDLAHSMDKTRPVTMVYGPTGPDNDKTADMVDLICVNRYYGWYSDMGHPETITKHLVWDLNMWHDKFAKPIIMTEYGAGSVNGLNADPPMTDFTESYQVNVLVQTWKAFDQLRAMNQTFLTGEMCWNFVDFMTHDGVKRVGGNRKGVLTRNRQPKMAGYAIRGRYHKLDNGCASDPFTTNSEEAFCPA